MIKFFGSKRLSLVCTAMNSAFAIYSFLQGDIGMGLLCSAFAGICFYNHERAGK